MKVLNYRNLTSLIVNVSYTFTDSHLISVCVFQRGSLSQIPVVKETRLESGQFLVLTIVSMVFVLGVLASSVSLFCQRHRSHLQLKEKLASLGTDTGADATATYQVRAGPLILNQSPHSMLSFSSPTG